MAGHSQFKNIMYRKGAQDAKRAKQFAKISKEIAVAVKMGGADLGANPRLRSAISSAKSLSMPKDNIERAIKKGEGNMEGTNYEEIRYEGYGPAGTAFIVEALTDNRNRSASEIRTVFSKKGGNLGETGSVSFMFTHVGLIVYPSTIASAEDVFEKALLAEGEDVISTEQGHEIYTTNTTLHQVATALESSLGEPETTQLIWRPTNEVTPKNVDEAKSILKLIEALEDLEDVQNVFGNFNIPDAFLKEILS